MRNVKKSTVAFINTFEELCSCYICTEDRLKKMPAGSTFMGPGVPGWKYACHFCGNKRCPHHADHRFKCTNSNDEDQVGELLDEFKV